MRRSRVHMKSDDWWLLAVRKYESRVAPFVCIPFSGGDARAYAHWVNLPLQVELWSVQLPGRRFRFNEPLTTNLRSFLMSISYAVKRLCSVSIVLFGHSLGGLMCYEVAREFAYRQFETCIKYVFISLCRGLGYYANKPVDTDAMSDNKIIKFIRRYRAILAKLLDDLEPLERFLAALRSDHPD